MSATASLKKYSHALYRSLYDPAQYREAMAEWKGFGGVYLMLLGLVIALPVVAYITYSTYAFRADELPYMLEQMPVVTVTKGVIKVDKPEPVTVKGKDTGFVLYINTKASEDELEDSKATVAVGKNYLLMRSGENYKFVPIERSQSFTITHDNIREFVDKVLHMLPVVILPFAIFSQIVNFLFQTFLIAIASYVLTTVMRIKIDFETRMRISALALTPAVVVNTLSLIIFAHPMMVWFNILLGVLFIYTMIMLMHRPAPDQI